MIDSYSAGGVVLNGIGQVLVVNQDGDSWSLPKGHINPNEDPLEAAKREIEEESGITQLKFLSNLGTYQRHQEVNRIVNKEIRKNITMFLFTTVQMKLKPTDPENPEARWVDKNNVVDLLTIEKDKLFFQKVLDTVLQK